MKTACRTKDRGRVGRPFLAADARRFTQMALLSALCWAVAVPHLLAAEPTHTTGPESGEHHPNAVELFLGNTYERADDETANGFSVGVTYERRLSDLLGVGGFYEYAAGDFDKWSIGVPLFVHPYGGWRLDLAPGLEHRDGEDEFLFRAGVAYEFELSERWAVMPEFNVDFVNGEQAFVFGLSCGFGF
jgi:hypothetical protein